MAKSTSSKVRGRKGKLGKNKHRIVAYYSSGRHYWNKARGIAQHIRRYGSDPVATTALKAQLAAMPLHLQREFEKRYQV